MESVETRYCGLSFDIRKDLNYTIFLMKNRVLILVILGVIIIGAIGLFSNKYEKNYQNKQG